MYQIELSVMVPDGDMKITWDPNNAEEMDQARAAIEDLRGKGYSFFLADGTQVETPGMEGALEVRRVSAEELLATQEKTGGRRGRKRQETGQETSEARSRSAAGSRSAEPTTTRAVAVPQRRGG